MGCQLEKLINASPDHPFWTTRQPTRIYPYLSGRKTPWIIRITSLVWSATQWLRKKNTERDYNPLSWRPLRRLLRILAVLVYPDKDRSAVFHFFGIPAGRCFSNWYTNRFLIGSLYFSLISRFMAAIGFFIGPFRAVLIGQQNSKRKGGG